MLGHQWSLLPLCGIQPMDGADRGWVAEPAGGQSGRPRMLSGLRSGIKRECGGPGAGSLPAARVEAPHRRRANVHGPRIEHRRELLRLLDRGQSGGIGQGRDLPSRSVVAEAREAGGIREADAGQPALARRRGVVGRPDEGLGPIRRRRRRVQGAADDAPVARRLGDQPPVVGSGDQVEGVAGERQVEQRRRRPGRRRCRRS